MWPVIATDLVIKHDGRKPNRKPVTEPVSVKISLKPVWWKTGFNQNRLGPKQVSHYPTLFENRFEIHFLIKIQKRP